MARNDHNEIAVTEAELIDLTGDLDEAHHESLPALHLATARVSEGMAPRARGAFSRRNFLATAGAALAGGIALGTPGIAGAARRSLASAPSASRGSAASLPLAVTVAALAASLENLAVSTYTAGLAAAVAGKLGKVPPAIGPFVTTAKAQHSDHAGAWNSIVKSAGYNAVTAADPVLQKSVNTSFAKVTDIAGLLKLALSLEEIAAATYLEAISALTISSAVEIAATIHPVEMQHAAIINFVIGSYPVPKAFATLTGAASTSDVAQLGVTKS